MNLSFDKSNWKSVSFGDVIKKINNRINPDTYHSEVVVEGGHINKRDFHIRKYANKNELGYLGPAFHMGFNKHQILYVSRNPHLMKVGYPDFDGICANTTYIMETKHDDVLRNDLIPFIMHSDSFIEQSVGNVRGGVNPYVNWPDLESIKFLLPPKSQQDEIAELLWAMDKVIQKDKYLFEISEMHLNSKVEQMIHNIELTNKTISEILVELSSITDVIELEKCGDFHKGKGISKGEVVQSGVPCIRYGELYTQHHRVIKNYSSYIEQSTTSQSFRLMKNDVLFAGSGETITEIGKSAAFTSDEEVYAGSDVLIFRPNQMDGAYLGYLMNSQLVRMQLNKYGTGAQVIHIYKDDLKKIRIPIVDYNKQVQIGKELEVLDYNQTLIKQKIESSERLLKSLINQLF